MSCPRAAYNSLSQVLRLPKARAILLKLEEFPAGTNPIDKMSKLYALAVKAKSETKIVLALDMILDARMIKSTHAITNYQNFELAPTNNNTEI